MMSYQVGRHGPQLDIGEYSALVLTRTLMCILFYEEQAHRV
jgi:hypothetical protein